MTLRGSTDRGQWESRRRALSEQTADRASAGEPAIEPRVQALDDLRALRGRSFKRLNATISSARVVVAVAG
jgi:hypothetical protein